MTTILQQYVVPRLGDGEYQTVPVENILKWHAKLQEVRRSTPKLDAELLILQHAMSGEVLGTLSITFEGFPDTEYPAGQSPTPSLPRDRRRKESLKLGRRQKRRLPRRISPVSSASRRATMPTSARMRLSHHLRPHRREAKAKAEARVPRARPVVAARGAQGGLTTRCSDNLEIHRTSLGSRRPMNTKLCKRASLMVLRIFQKYCLNRCIIDRMTLLASCTAESLKMSINVCKIDKKLLLCCSQDGKCWQMIQIGSLCLKTHG